MIVNIKEMIKEFEELFELIDTNKELLPTGDYVKACNLFKEIYNNGDSHNNLTFTIAENSSLLPIEDKELSYYLNNDYRLVKLTYFNYFTTWRCDFCPSKKCMVCFISDDEYKTYLNNSYSTCMFQEHSKMKNLKFVTLSKYNFIKIDIFDYKKQKTISNEEKIKIANNYLLDFKLIRRNSKRYNKFIEHINVYGYSSQMSVL